MRTHIGEKPFCCQECGKRFFTAGEQTKHMQTHTGEKTYCCLKCGKKIFHCQQLDQAHANTHQIKTFLLPVEWKKIFPDQQPSRAHKNKHWRKAVKELPNFNASIPTNEVVSQYNHLSGLNFPEISKQKVEILIGADVWQAHVIHESIEGEPDQPRALRTGFGWTLFGPDPRMHGCEMYVVNCTQSTNDMLHEQLTKMFNCEFCNSQTYDAPYSVEDKQPPQKAETSVTKVNGHYQQQPPSNDADVILLDNRLTVENRSALKVIVSCFESHKGKERTC